MNRRDWMKTLAASGAPPAAAAAPGARLETEIVRLKLRHTWTTTMSSSEYRDVLYVRYIGEGIAGRGEGAPIVRYKESAGTGKKAVDAIASLVASADPRHFAEVMRMVFARLPGEWAAKAAIDIALLDWVGQKLGTPIYGLFGLDPRKAPVTTFSIGIDTPETTRRKVREAAAFPVLKIKVGLDTDEQTIEAVRGVTNKPLRVDANEGWKDKDVAVRKIRWLEKQGVELIEQPLPAAMLEEMNYVRGKVGIPVFADEACRHPSDIPKLAPYFDGVNVKVDKCGGLLEAHRMIEIARSLGLKTMLGCMVSSSVAITAAAHLSPLADYADLDGNLLIANDPFRGVTVEGGKLVLPARPGLGVVPA